MKCELCNSEINIDELVLDKVEHRYHGYCYFLSSAWFITLGYIGIDENRIDYILANIRKNTEEYHTALINAQKKAEL